MSIFSKDFPVPMTTRPADTDGTGLDGGDEAGAMDADIVDMALWSPTPSVGPATATASSTLDRAADHLLGLQSPEGWWKGELETNVTMDAEDLLLREFLGIRRDPETARAALWIRSQQRADGTWANFYGGPAELSTTVEAYVALRLAGDAVEEPHMARAAAFVLASGGIEATRVFTRIWLAMFGMWSWDDLPVMPPELLLLPARVPLNIYDFACWSRQTVAALTVVGAHRPAHPLAFGIDELRAGTGAVRQRASTRTGRWFDRMDRVLHLYERRPVRVLRRISLARAEQWIVKRQEADGSWGGIQPPWVYSLIALHLRGYSLDHPVIRGGLDGLDRFTINDEAGRRIEACQSPVWDTALAVVALADAGLEAYPAVTRAASWLVDQEVTTEGDWNVRRPGLAPGGWAFEFENDNYPDIDDTAEVVLALKRSAVRCDPAVERAIEWVEGMQCQDGGWAAFDADNVQALCRELPFCDFGELIDPPSADVTAHVVEMLAVAGRSGTPLARGVQWLLDHQEPDGSWFGRWGANYVYGTGAVLPALAKAGVAPDHPAVTGGVRWLEQHQNPDGGWGEDLRSYDDPAWRGRGASTASQTGWALLALLGVGARGPAVDRGIEYLSDTQRNDGTWDEPYYTGVGFPGDFYINYHLYRLVFPVMALGRYLKGGEHG